MTTRPTMLAPILAVLTLAAAEPAAALPAQPPVGPSAQAPARPERFVRVVARGTRALNVPSRDGTTVVQLDPELVLAVHGERAGFLEVEVPGGLPVYIFGKYARTTDVEGVVEITGNSLNLRPLPSSDEQSFPLAQKLYRGDRVRVVSRTNPALPLEQDWLRVQAPAGVRAWVDAKDTEPLAAGEDGAALWRAAGLAAAKASPAQARAMERPGGAAEGRTASADPGGAKEGATRQASSQLATAGAEARAMLEEGDRRMAAVRAGSGDLQAARAAYERVLELAPATSEAALARTRLEEIDTREELERLRADVAQYEARRQQELEEARAALEKLEARKDPLRGGRYDVRGWLERSKRRDGSDAWLVRWAGEQTAEIVCTSGRYDLSIFADCEVGIAGASMPGGGGRPRVIDASRIEVLSGRRPAR